MDVGIRTVVRQRAQQRCEYCGIPETAYPISFHVEHIVASVHQRDDSLNNLAWACPPCNAHKGPNLVTIDPESGEQIDLFNPREHTWSDHFQMKDSIIIGKTAIGRGTLRLLNMNEVRRIELRQSYVLG